MEQNRLINRHCNFSKGISAINFLITSFILLITIPITISYSQWVQLADMPTARNSHAIATVNGKIYAVGGEQATSRVLEEYDPTTDTWETKTEMPTKRGWLSFCAVNGKIYAIGGYNSSFANKTVRNVEEYDPATDTWQTKSPMPAARWGHGAGVFDGKIYVIGGARNWPIDRMYDAVQVYDPMLDTWTKMSSVSTKRWSISCCVVSGKIYAIGGYNSSSRSTVEEYDPIADTWEVKESIPTPRWGQTAGVVNEKIYIIGGAEAYPPTHALSLVEEYDPILNIWETNTQMPVGRIAHAPSSVSIDGKLYVIGGGGVEVSETYSEAYSFVPEKKSKIINGSIEFGGTNRNFIVSLPQTLKPNMPAVFNLHGYTDYAQLQMEYSLMNEIADTAGFIVVYPDAVSPGFNTGLVYGSWPPLPTHIDDVGFISELIDTIISVYNADKNRIYCCGVSNGGMMTLKLAVQLGHRFAAYGSVVGAFLDPILERYHMVGTHPILICHGTDDVLVHYNGGPYPMMWSVDETVGFWVQNNNCNPLYTSIMLPDLDPTDGCTVEKRTYKDFSNNTRIVFYRVIDGGHNWPDANPDPSYRFPAEGNVNRDINMNAELLNFFKDFENPLVNMAYGKSLNLYPGYIGLSGDTLWLNALVNNPENHASRVYALINADSSVFQDSIELYDDGMHNDGNAQDNYWGGSKFLTGLDIDYYSAALYTNDLNHNTTQLYRFESQFTTAGPIEFGSTDIDTVSDGRIALKNFELVNRGNEMTVENIEAELTTLDTNIEFSLSTKYFGDISAGESKTIPAAFAFIAENDAQLIEFEIKIKSNNIEYWTDSFILDVTNLTDLDNESTSIPNEYLLEQNYPNPFNPSTTIQYQIPAQGWNDNIYVTLKIYDILGKEVVTLVNKKQKSGNYEVEFEGKDLSSGIYFYRLRAGDFIQSKKMILLR